VGAWYGCRRLGLPLSFFADAAAPGLPVAQAIGRWGNWFNNELYGGHTDLPWGLKVYDYDLSAGQAKLDANGDPILKVLDDGTVGPFHPTFLYESVWCFGVALLVWLVDRKWKLGKGRAFALYVMAYTVGRFWIETMRTDEAHAFFGLRVNNWVSILVFLGALIYFVMVKGPQAHVTVLEDGSLQVVTAEGTPIAWRGAKADAAAVSDGSDGDAPSDGSDADAGSDSDPPGDGASTNGAKGDAPATADAAAEKK
jgi:prolipoprotein diacylglyceryltransferase